jgi:hypothetical protein
LSNGSAFCSTECQAGWARLLPDPHRHQSIEPTPRWAVDRMRRRKRDLQTAPAAFAKHAPPVAIPPPA